MKDEKRPNIVLPLNGCAPVAATLILCITALLIAMFAYDQTQAVFAVIASCFWVALKIGGVLLSICFVIGGIVCFIIYREGK